VIVVKGNTIMVSQNDTFLTFFKMAAEGYILKGTETVRFSIKENLGDLNPLITTTCFIDIANNIIRVFIDKSLMVRLAAGNYYYDLDLTRLDGFHTTLVYPSKFIVREVVHNDGAGN